MIHYKKNLQVMNVAQLIEFNMQEDSPFESEPQLLDVYHWSGENLRSMHKHDDRLELYFVLSGNGTQVIDGELFNVQAGDVLIHNAGVLYDESLMICSNLETWCIAVKNLKLPNLPVNELVPKNFSPRIPCQAVAKELAKLYPLVHAQQKDSYQVANDLARKIVLIVYNVINSAALDMTYKKNLIVEQVKNYIEENYAEHLDFDQFNKMFHYADKYVERLFKKVTGYSPKQYVLRRRISKAQCYLIYTSLSVTEISSRVGYDDPNYFSHKFKKIIGMSPYIYRQKWHELSSAP